MMYLLSNSMAELEEMLLDLDHACTEMGLSISAQKTKILAVTNDLHDTPRSITILSVIEPVEVVEGFEYLGSVVISIYRLDREIN